MSSNGTYGTLHAGAVDLENADLAEKYPSSQSLLPGQVVAFDPNHQGQVITTTSAYQSSLFGVVSTAPGVTLGNSDAITSGRLYPIALTGRVPINIDPTSDPISIGDHLTSSDLSGTAIKATKPGPSIARALEAWTPDSGKAQIMAFINLSYFSPSWSDFTPTINLQQAATPSASMLALDENGNPIRLASLALLPDPLSAPSSTTPTDLLSPSSTGSASPISTSSATPIANSALNQLRHLGQLALSKLTSFNLDVFGLLTANRIATNQLISPLVTTDQLSTNLITPLATTSAIVLAGDTSISGTLYASSIDSPSLEALAQEASATAHQFATDLFNQTQLRQDYLRQTAQQALLEATASSQLLADISTAWHTDQLGNHLNLNSLYADTGSFQDIIVSNNLLTTSLSTPPSQSTLNLQPSGQGTINLLAGLMILDSTGNITINGDLTVTGQLYAQSITTDQATISGTLNLTANQSTGFGKLLAIYDEQGQEVGSISASGSANFQDVAIQQLIIASAKSNTDLASSTATTSSNATIGIATLPAGQTQVHIDNPNIDNSTLVYLTPISDTQNQVLYVLNKASTTNSTLGYFTVAINQSIPTDISFNYWLIKLQ